MKTEKSEAGRRVPYLSIQVQDICVLLYLGKLAPALKLRLPGCLGSVAGSCNPFAMKGGNGGPLVRRAVTLRSDTSASGYGLL